MVVLLKRKFGWKDPHKYWPAHVARARSEQTQLDQETLDHIREMNQFDFALYQFASELMETQINASGETFEHDLRIFKSQRAKMLEGACLEHPKAARQVEAVLRRVERDSKL